MGDRGATLTLNGHLKVRKSKNCKEVLSKKLTRHQVQNPKKEQQNYKYNVQPY